MHRRDPHVPLEESVGAMAELVARRARSSTSGLSEVTGGRAARRARRAPDRRRAVGVVAVQPGRRGRPWCRPPRELGVALVPYSPLGRGFLTGAFADADKDLDAGRLPPHTSPASPATTPAANAALLEPVRTIAAAHGATPAQIALAWVQQQAAVARPDGGPDPGHPQAQPRRGERGGHPDRR